MESEAAMENRTPLGLLTPSQQNGESEPLDFSKLTPSQFGITTNSFTAFSKEKDKSRVAQLKARRRSTIGVRGSPETNSLICFRAKQFMKTPPRTPQHLLESPFFSGCDSIKQKMAAFQRLMGADEENTEQEGEKDGARHAQSDTDDGSEERENRVAPVTPPLSKRRRRATPHRSLCEEKIDEEPPSEFSQQVESSEFKSPKVPSSLGLGLGLDSQSQLMSLPMLSKPELIKTGDTEVSSVSKKKRVRFGAPLSPEFFDKTLPPSTPLQKGATPARPPSSTGRKHSLLKTPQRSEPRLPQPDFSSPGTNGASPVLTTRRYRDEGLDNDEVFLDNQKIAFPIMDEEYDNPPVDSKDSDELLTHTTDPKTTDTDCEEDQEPRLSFPPAPDVPAAPPPAEPELKSDPDDQHQPPKTAESTAKAQRPRGRKRKQPADDEKTETRRSSRSAAESAKGKMKTSSAKKRFGTKEVDRSLYGKRDYASKNPLLSPIVESSLISTPTQLHTDTNPDSSPVSSPSSKRSKTAMPETTAHLVAAAALWRRRFLSQSVGSDSDTDMSDRSVLTDAPVQSEASVEPSVVPPDRRASTGRAARGRRNPANRRRSGTKAQDEHEDGERKTEAHQSESDQEENPAGQDSVCEKSDPGVGRKSEPKSPSRGKPRGRRNSRVKNISMVVEEDEEICQDMVEPSGREKEVEEQKDEDVRQTTGHEVDGDAREANGQEVEEKNDEDMRETTGHEVDAEKGGDVRETRGHEVEEKKDEDIRKVTGHEVEEQKDEDMRQVTGHEVEQKDEDMNPSSAPEENLEPWQQLDFCIEDVLKPITKSRGPVRRSLRHRRSVDVSSKGLAWVEHTSPQMISTYQRRKTRGRLSAVSQPPDSEETSSVH